jgi:hypothetical protein
MATAAEHSGRYRARRHDDEIIPWSRCRAGQLQCRMSAFGTKRTSHSRPAMSAFEGKADMTRTQCDFRI